MKAQGAELTKRPVDGRNCGTSAVDNGGRTFCDTAHIVGGEARRNDCFARP